MTLTFVITLSLTLILTTVTFGDEICHNTVQCELIQAFDVTMDVKNDEAALSWSFNSSHNFYGFRATITNDDGIFYESPLMHIEERKVTVKKELKSGKNEFCLQVWYNSSATTLVKCNTFTQTDFKAVIGILAGTIFILPCIVGLLFIIYKDRKVSAQEQYSYLKAEADKENQQLIITEKKPDEKKGKEKAKTACGVGQVNVGFLDEGKGIKNGQTSVHNVQVAHADAEKNGQKTTEFEVKESKAEPLFIKQTNEGPETGPLKDEGRTDDGPKSQDIYVIKM